MGVFNDIELEWLGKVYTIRGQRVMGAISRIEDVITLQELQGYCVRGTPPVAKLCMAYASVLRYAGVQVSDDDVYAQAFEGSDAQEAIGQAVTNIMKMMFPASARARLEAALSEADAPEAVKEPDLGNSAATARASSKRRTKRRSQKANG